MTHKNFEDFTYEQASYLADLLVEEELMEVAACKGYTPDQALELLKLGCLRTIAERLGDIAEDLYDISNN